MTFTLDQLIAINAYNEYAYRAGVIDGETYCTKRIRIRAMIQAILAS